MKISSSQKEMIAVLLHNRMAEQAQPLRFAWNISTRTSRANIQKYSKWEIGIKDYSSPGSNFT
jgi:hypothetical protein